MSETAAVPSAAFARLEEQRDWRAGLNWLAAILISLIFFVAGLWKVTDPAGAAVRLGWSPLAACPAIAYLSLQENYKLSASLCVIVYHYIPS